MRKFGLLLALFAIIGLSGCGKSLAQLKASSDASIDAVASAAKTVAKHVDEAGSEAINGGIDNGAGIAKRLVDLGLAIYADMKDNIESVTSGLSQ